MTFIETSTFTKLIGTYLSDDEYLGLQGFLFKYPCQQATWQPASASKVSHKHYASELTLEKFYDVNNVV